MSALNHCHLVRHDDGRRPLDPRLGAVRVDGGLGLGVPARRPHRDVGRQRQPGRAVRSRVSASWASDAGRASPRACPRSCSSVRPSRSGRRCARSVSPAPGRGPWRDSTIARAQSSSERRAMASSLSGRWPAMAIRYSSTATSARARVLIPSGVRRSSTRRRSVSSWRRSTKPRATSPSMSAVMEGRRTASRSARPEAAADPSARMPRTRYWGRVSSTWPNATSTRLDSQAATRPYVPRTGGAAVAFDPARAPALPRDAASAERGEVTDTSSIIQLDALTTCSRGPSGTRVRTPGRSIRGRVGAGRGRSASPRRPRRWPPPPAAACAVNGGSPGWARRASARSPSRASRRPAAHRAPVVAHPGEGVAIDGVVGELGQVRPGLQAMRIPGRHGGHRLADAGRAGGTGRRRERRPTRDRAGRGRSRGSRR